MQKDTIIMLLQQAGYKKEGSFWVNHERKNIVSESEVNEAAQQPLRDTVTGVVMDMYDNYITIEIPFNAPSYAEVTAENEQLKHWKKEAMEVIAPMQEIGKAIGVPLGQSIHDKILPAIERLTLEKDIAQGSNRELRELLESLNKTMDNYWNSPVKSDKLVKLITFQQRRVNEALNK